MWWSDFHFLRPYWFLALIPFIVLVWYLSKKHLINKHWETVCDPALLPYILVGKTGAKQFVPVVLLSIAVVLAIIALAGPTWERLPQPVFQKQSALVIALDLSYSMYADDIKPSRLARARFEISDLLELRKEGLTALLVYAGNAFTVTPLTDDIKTIKSQLSALSPAIMPAPGSDTGLAINKAVELLKQAGIRSGHILVITDEIEALHKNAFNRAAAGGYVVSVLAVGTEAGAPITLQDGSFLKNRTGAIVIPELDQRQLRELALEGSGRYEWSRVGDTEIERLNIFFDQGPDRTEKTETGFETDQWYEFGPWLVLFIIPPAAMVFRRGYL